MAEPEHRRVLEHLLALVRQVAGGNYDRAQDIFELTKRRVSDPLVAELAEAFGMMLVQVEAREFRLTQLIEDLQATNQKLETTLRKVKLLEDIKGHLGKFVPDSVRSLILSNPQSPDLDKRERDVSVLFLDVAGYTRLSEQVEPREMNYLIEHYFSAYLDDIHQNQGDINETAGDGLMIIFMAPEPEENALNAVQAAVSIQEKTRRINRQDPVRHRPITVNIGINSGSCSVGSTRFQGVSGTRYTFTASGTTTNLAARLGDLASEGRIFIGPETSRRVGERFSTRSLGLRQIKNLSQPVEVFEVLLADA